MCEELSWKSWATQILVWHLKKKINISVWCIMYFCLFLFVFPERRVPTENQKLQSIALIILDVGFATLSNMLIFFYNVGARMDLLLSCDFLVLRRYFSLAVCWQLPSGRRQPTEYLEYQTPLQITNARLEYLKCTLCTQMLASLETSVTTACLQPLVIIIKKNLEGFMGRN